MSDGLDEQHPEYEEDEVGTDIIEPFSEGSFFGDRFRIDELLGVGAMGSVFKATDLRTTEKVALKVLIKQKQGAEDRQRFAREAEILSQLDHPGIVSIRGFGHAHGRIPWLAMELLDGETLGAKIRRGGPIPPEELQPLLKAICEPLQIAHGAGVIHRDLKPDHVLITEDQRVKLIDFGLSSLRSGKKLTATGTVIGTPRYMAPELLTSARNASAASDVYALAVIVYECLCGHSPFAASDHGQLLGAIMQGKTEPLSAHLPGLPAIDSLLQKAMSKEPRDRPTSPNAFALEFATAAGLRPSFSGEYSSARPRKRVMSPVVSLIVAGTLAALIGGLVGYFLLR